MTYASGAELTLLALDRHGAGPGEDEEIFLVSRLGVVQRARLPRLKHGETDPELVEVERLVVGATHDGAVRLERAALPERVVADF